jgi:hypothetical protein
VFCEFFSSFFLSLFSLFSLCSLLFYLSSSTRLFILRVLDKPSSLPPSARTTTTNQQQQQININNNDREK